MLLFCPIMLLFCPILVPIFPNNVSNTRNTKRSLWALFSTSHHFQAHKEFVFPFCSIMFLFCHKWSFSSIMFLMLDYEIGFRPFYSFLTNRDHNKEFLFPFYLLMFLFCPLMFLILDIINVVSGLLFLFNHSNQRVSVPFSSINVPVLAKDVSNSYLKYEITFRPFYVPF